MIATGIAEQGWFPFAFLALVVAVAVVSHFTGKWVAERYFLRFMIDNKPPEVILDRPLRFVPQRDGSVDIEGPGIAYSNVVRPGRITLIVRVPGERKL